MIANYDSRGDAPELVAAVAGSIARVNAESRALFDAGDPGGWPFPVAGEQTCSHVIERTTRIKGRWWQRDTVSTSRARCALRTGHVGRPHYTGPGTWIAMDPW